MIPLDERKQIWQWLHALDCFQHVDRVCEFILEQNITNGHPLYHSLLTAVFVLYGRPFKKSHGVGRLPDGIVPKELLDIHNDLLIHRDKIFAHTDVNGVLEDEGLNLNQVDLTVDDGFYQWRVRTVQPERERVAEFRSLSQKLARKVDYHIQKFNKKWGRSAPYSNGTYRLNLSPDSEDAFEREVDFSAEQP